MLTDSFMTGVSELLVPEMGTESVGPLLYWLVRMVQPTTVLEVGMGYSTPFLALALMDNDESAKDTKALLSRGEHNELPLAFPEFYDLTRSPRLICIDRMTDPTSSAPRVAEALEDLRLSRYCEIIEGDLRDGRDQVQNSERLIDLAWIDTWDTLSFIRVFWDLINSAGGVLAIHWLLTYPEGRSVLRYIESMRRIEDGRLEVLSLREPHKVAQNSLTLIRRTRNYIDPHDLRPDRSANDPVRSLY